MNLPSFPTDNLYKFLAISGLFICIFSVVYPWTQISELKLKLVEVNTHIKVLKIEREEIDNERMMLQKITDSIIERLSKGIKSQKENEFIDNMLRELLNKYLNQHHNIYLLKIKGEEILGQNEQINVLNNEQGRYSIFLIIGSFGGLFLSFFGFNRWYHIVQKPSDLILRKQAEDIQLKKTVSEKDLSSTGKNT